MFYSSLKGYMNLSMNRAKFEIVLVFLIPITYFSPTMGSILPDRMRNNTAIDTFLRIHIEKALQDAQWKFDHMDEAYNNVSDDCYRDMKVLHAALTQPQVYQWALMWDNANGQGTYGTEKGSLLGSQNAIGSYDLCKKVKATQQEVTVKDESGQNVTVGLHDFNNRYCRAFHRFKKPYYWLSEGWCMAESCKKQDIESIMPDYPPASKYVYCEDEDRPKQLSTGAVVTVVICVLLISLIVTATAYDGISRFHKKTVTAEKEKSCNVGQDAEKEKVSELSLEKEATDGKEQPGVIQRLLLCFSIYTTLPMVLQTRQGGYEAMYGLRVIAMSWIVLAHTWVANDWIRVVVENNFVWYDRRVERQLLRTDGFHVDIFFLLSGCLATLSFLKIIEHHKTADMCSRVKAFLLYVLHRYIRLTPVVVACMMLWANLWPYLGQGPLYPEHTAMADECKPHWWTLLLYINNFFLNNWCIGHAWYLAVDFQLYLVAPIFVGLLYWKPVIGGIFLGLGCLGNFIARYFIPLTDHNWFFDIYAKPWCRFGVYAQGIALGYIIYRTKCKVKIHWALAVLGWIVAAILCLLVVFGGHNLPKAAQVPNELFKRDAFGLGIAWVLFACLTGYGGWANTFLSWNFFQVLSKLSYCVYMIHPMIHFVHMFRRHQLYFVQDVSIMYHYFGTLCLAVILSLPFTLVFELPFILLDKYFISAPKTN